MIPVDCVVLGCRWDWDSVGKSRTLGSRQALSILRSCLSVHTEGNLLHLSQLGRLMLSGSWQPVALLTSISPQHTCVVSGRGDNKWLFQKGNLDSQKPWKGRSSHQPGHIPEVSYVYRDSGVDSLRSLSGVTETLVSYTLCACAHSSTPFGRSLSSAVV